ncbi:OmpA family protein [Pseudoxanthomonas sp. CF385]|uniref:DUF7507 domain-containing protein n=1 Tax=Pseudoxanthomonas sp. CF385 TaxID=1881042 RepID=UPI0011140E65|nr:OmpA family protein [Pseudoxanthomonas sp. CF385]
MATASGLFLAALAFLAPAHAQTSVQNTATVALPPGAPVVDSNPANNTSTATVGVLALPRLTLVKQVVNDNGGAAAAAAWTLVAAGASTTISGATGTAAVTNATVPAGTYALSETGGAAGYTAGTWSCVKNGAAAVSANSISLVGNDVATCTIINNDQAATLTLVKTVINDNGGAATVSNFPLTATGPTTITGVSGAAAVTNASVNAGVYTLSEVTAAGYTAGSWSCTAGTLSGTQLTLANGQSASCSITNNDRAATLTLVKTVINDNGGTATVSNFPLTATGPTTITGVSGAAAVTNASVNAGVYTLSEVAAAGYTAGSWSCTAGTLSGTQLTLANGQSASCSITNNDRAATLTLVKTVINDNGGTATISNFPLTATGPTTITGVSGSAAVTNASVNAGVYTLSEVTAAGYTAGSWSCTAGTLSGNQLTLANGQSASCSITNNDQAATLTLVKTVINDNGGTATISNFPLTATGPTTITGVSGAAAVTNASVNAGVYTLSEVTAAGYTAGSWSCTAGTLSGNQLTLSNGQSASCSITNNDQAATLTLVKTVVNTGGGTATPASWTLTATGPTSISGAGGATGQVSAGSYTLSESAGPADYVAGAWNCTAGTLSGNRVVLANGQTATCTIVNTFQSAPALTLDKTTTTPTYASVGQVLSYSYLVTNSGNTTITSAITVVDDRIATVTCPALPAGGLLPTQSITCSATYTVTQADLDAGTVTNIARASDGTTTSPTDTVTVTATQTRALTLDKTTTTPTYASVGQVLSYSYLVTNSGNTTITSAITVVDDRIATVTCPALPAGGLLPTQSITCSATYTVTQADLDAGTVTNIARASDGTTTSPTDTVTVTATQTPGQSLVKAMTADSTGGAVAVGDVLTYTVTMTNTGNTTLANVVMSDALITPNSITCPNVAPGATCQLVGTYTVTQADADAGNIRNTAVVTSPVCPVGSTAPACTTTIDTPVINPVVTYAKAVALPIGQTEVSTGDTLTYTLNVQVSAAATTSVVTLTDTLGAGLTLATVSAGSFSCGTSNPLVCTLPAGTAPGTYSVSYTAIVNDQATGTVRNTVVGTGDDAPTCAGTCRTETPVTEPLPPLVTYAKSAVLPTGRSEVAVGDSVTYTLTTNVINAVTTADVVLTDTLGAGLTFGTVTNAGAYAANTSGAPVLRFTLPAGTTPGTYIVSYTAIVNPAARGTVNNAVVGTGNDAPTCAGNCGTSSPVAEPRVTVSKSSNPATGTQVQVGQTVRYTLSVDVGVSALTGEVVLVDTPDRGLTLGALPAGCSFDGTVLTCRLPAGTTTGLHALSYDAVVNANAGTVVGNQVVATGGGGETPVCTACSTEHQLDAPEIRVSKTAGSREVRIGDLVRYTLAIENVGAMDLVGGSIVDTPAAGFSYVEGSLVANDADGMATVSGGSPLRFSGVDVAAGQTATLVYVMRVGAGVRPGTHVNQAQVRSATDDPVSNIATAEVQLTADPLLNDSLLFGTVFNDRDGDGWQDSAALSGVKVQGGFAPTAYIANSTTVDRGAGLQPEADASSPLLHGIAVGAITGRQSVTDPVEQHAVVIRQHLSEPAFTDDFVLTSAEGVTVRMDAAGNTTVQTNGDAAKGLTAAAPTVERRVAQGDGGYVVDYVIRNAGIDERGIPGVRIASVEGLLIETDQFGRYHLAGVPGGAWERGRNFILKVDPSTLPAGAEFTTDNPLLRRITPGVPVRFDWGVKLPEQVIEGGSKQVELEMGEVFFAPGSAEVREKYLPVIEAMAAKVREYQGGEVVIHANGDSEGLAFDRANAVKAALLSTLDAASAKGLVVSVRGTVDDPSSMIVGVDEGGALLGTVLFDTDKSAIKPAFEPLLDKVATALEKRGGGSIAIVGHTDVRASHAYNVALGMRRAKAVYEALAKRLSPEVRAKVRVETSNDPTAPVGVRK